MKKDKKKLKCGACGCKKVTLYTNKNKDLFAECNQCKSTTEIKVYAGIEFDWGDNSKGILC